MNVQVESNVGIRSYLSDHNGFSAIIKQRYSDFLVNEIGQDGEIIHLTCEEVVPVPADFSAIPSNNETQPAEIKDEDIELLKLLSGQISLEHVKPSTFIVGIEGDNYIKKDFDMKNFKNVKINVDNVSKERRTVIHKYLKGKFQNLDCVTMDCDSSKFIVATKKGNSKSRPVRSSWPVSQRYVTFILYKENIDTIDAVNVIQGKLRLRPNMIAYAGVKDKRAKTAQLVTVSQVSPQNISATVRKHPRIHVGNFTFRNKPLKLGSLSGNYFQIVLRDARVEDSALEVAMKSLRENGFINYFGMQRFGSVSLTTHLIGKAILKGNFREAIDLVLSPNGADSYYMLEAKRIWASTRDASHALEILSHSRFSIEKQVLSALAKHGASNFVTSFEKLPRNVSLMYVHAYQSYIWNCVVSKRIEKYGLKVLPGDLIFKEAKNVKILDSLSESKNEVKNELCDHNILEDCCDCEDLEDKNKKPFVHMLTEDEVDHFSISEIVMPVPGLQSKYPNNEIRNWYNEYLENDGISFDKLELKVKTFHVGGSYRKVVVRVGKLNYSSCYYNDVRLPLLPSDLDRIKDNLNSFKNRLQRGRYKAVIVNFSLPPSSYATMALRELMKIETSAQFQESLNTTASSTSTDNELETKSDYSDKEIESEISKEISDKTMESNKRSNDSIFTDNELEIKSDSSDKEIKSEISNEISDKTMESNKRSNDFEDNSNEKRRKIV